MAGKSFLNYRREDSTGTAGRLHDRLAQEFGRSNLFVDVDGTDLRVRLNNQIAACQVLLTVIGPNWLDSKDEAGEHRLHHPDDFVALEIAAALSHNIRIIPVLVDGARMPKMSWLPDPLKQLARCQAVEVHQNNFDEDIETLVETVREALNGGFVGQRSRRRLAMAWVAAAAGVLLAGWIGFYWMGISKWPPWADTPEASNSKLQAEAEAKRRGEQAVQQQVETLKAERERQIRAAAEAEAKRKSEEAEQQRAAALKSEEERKRAEGEAQARYAALISRGNTDSNAGAYDRAIAAYNEAIRLDPKSALAFRSRGDAYASKGDNNRAIADFTEAIRLDPKSALAFSYRGVGYANKGDYDRAIADFNMAIQLDPRSTHAFRNRGVVYAHKGDDNRAIADLNEAIRLDPKNALAFRNRGDAYTNKGDNDRAIADFTEAIRLDPKSALALSYRGVGYANKGSYDRAIADFDEAIRLDPKSSHAFRNRGIVYALKGDYNRAIADFNVAIRLDPSNALAFCNRGRAKLKINDSSGYADFEKARQLDPSSCR
jgi:tetratricopeptide (TPR) repeat protein